jgi:hypothetical protein
MRMAVVNSGSASVAHRIVEARRIPCRLNVNAPASVRACVRVSACGGNSPGSAGQRDRP